MKKRDIIGLSISGGLCLVLALVAMFIPGDAQTGVMFASYAAGYVAFMWLLYTAYQRFMVDAKSNNPQAQAFADQPASTDDSPAGDNS